MIEWRKRWVGRRVGLERGAGEKGLSLKVRRKYRHVANYFICTVVIHRNAELVFLFFNVCGPAFFNKIRMAAFL